jgi:hypothetical protein
MKPNLKPPGTKRLKPKRDTLLSNFASKFNLRRYILVVVDALYYGRDLTEVVQCTLSPKP